MPLVTVVVPTYNRAHLLRGAIQSVLAQKYTSFRLVVSDNVSSDVTPRVIADFDDPRLIYVRRSTHVDLNQHYNEFTSAIDTKYLFILPDDDLMLPRCLESLVPILEQHPRVGMVHGRARIEDSNGRTIAPSHDMTGFAGDVIESGDQFILEAMSTSHRVHGSTVLFRMDALRSLSLDSRDYPATEFGLWLRMALDWAIAFTATTVAVYRIHSNTYTAGHAKVGGGGYVQTLDSIHNIHQVKLRFLKDNAARLGDTRSLRHNARRALTAQLVNFAGHATLPERRLALTIRTLTACAQLGPGVLLNAGAWRLLAGSMIGPRLATRLSASRRGSPLAKCG